jgi:hypothetical protein
MSESRSPPSDVSFFSNSCHPQSITSRWQYACSCRVKWIISDITSRAWWKSSRRTAKKKGEKELKKMDATFFICLKKKKEEEGEEREREGER